MAQRVARVAKIYEDLERIAPEIARRFQEAAKKARNEAEFVRRANTILEGVATSLEVDLLLSLEELRG